MKASILLGFMSILIFITGCGSKEKQESEDPGTVKVDILNKQNAVTADGDFIYRLVTEKAEYSLGETVKIYAELEYIGEQDSITIYHAASPFSFPIEERTRGYSIGYNMNTPLLNTTLKRGEPLREEYKNSGGFGETDERAYIDFIKSLWADGFPAGYYVVDGFADFYVESKVDGEDKEEDYTIKSQIDFTVTE
ncbi:hypothetical protein [Paenibacillus spongiae]|uniref:Uncharacterized protein n=1 Tax=Paenibacillus spongiae TaxID=2909671 RepID=A0ABY5SGD5_9BACL|nr:hypothetical protein [Paenibacillus spongiae]UVI33067.1 hypothetical protein L1F29_15035 [Paenibacillus spongiae]